MSKQLNSMDLKANNIWIKNTPTTSTIYKINFYGFLVTI